MTSHLNLFLFNFFFKFYLSHLYPQHGAPTHKLRSGVTPSSNRASQVSLNGCFQNISTGEGEGRVGFIGLNSGSTE